MFKLTALFTAGLGLTLAAGSAHAVLVSQYGILDLTANGGINPNTGFAWQAGDQYRLAFHTADGITATSNTVADYDNFAIAQAQSSTLGNGDIQTSTGWTAMIWVNTDGSLAQAADLNNVLAGESPISSPVVRSGTDVQDTANQGGAGVPVYAMDGMTAIARNNADIYNSWSNPFEDAPGVVNTTGTGNNTRRIDTGDIDTSPHYSPFLDQNGTGDTGAIHGPDVWTGGFGGPVNPAGDTTNEVRTSHGNSNANRTGRVWNRFNRDNVQTKRLYVISDLLTIMDSGGITGDFDGDGDVDGVDVATMFSNFNGPGGGVPANPDTDLDNDGDADGVDVATLFGLFTGPLAPASVPEPTSLALLGLGALTIARRRR